MCTDNPVLLKNTKNLRTIICVQRKAEKIIPTEADLIKANKLAFNDDIGIVTNHVTGMFDVQSKYKKDSIEYKELEYRIMCGQLYQQNCIDRAKGIIAKPMPEYWYSIRSITEDSIPYPEALQLNKKIVSPYKPYFMIYVYPQLRKRLNDYIKDNDKDIRRKFSKHRIKNIDELVSFENKTEKMLDFLSYYDDQKAIGDNPCTVNRICWFFEECFPSYGKMFENSPKFDYSILKCNVEYSKSSYNEILNLYNRYKKELDSFRQQQRTYGYVEDSCGEYSKEDFINRFKRMGREICSDEKELCDIVIDICYEKESSKQFVWDVVGDVIIENLLKKNNYAISFPEHIGDEFTYCGENFSMNTIYLNGVDQNLSF